LRINTGQGVINNSVDIQNLQSLARNINYQFYVYTPREAFNSESRKRRITNYLLEAKRFAAEQSRNFKCLIVVVLAKCENALSGMRPYFFDNSSDRMEFGINFLTSPFFENNFMCFRGKPKIFIIYAPEKHIAQESGTVREERPTPSIQLDTNFFLCIARPPEMFSLMNERSEESFFIHHLCKTIKDHPQYEINQSMRMLHNQFNENIHNSIINSGRDISAADLITNYSLENELYFFQEH